MRRSHAELVAANAAVRARLEAGAEEALRAVPGVVHVSVGLKERDGRVTDELCIRVYVREKVPDSVLPAAARVPREIDGVPTDVLVVRRAEASLYNEAAFRPVKGGTLISNRVLGLDEEGDPSVTVGTLGCMATKNTDNDVVLLSNWHVLTAYGAALGDPIYQPGDLDIPAGIDPNTLPIKPSSEDQMIARIVGAVINNKVDAAIARLDVSSCCRCCGIDWRDEIVGLSVDGTPPSNKLLGQRPAVAGETVFKVGVRTGRTEGVITDASYPPMQMTMGTQQFPFDGQIEIASAIDPDLDPFSLTGDSGSAIVAEDGYIVGLLFGSYAGEVLGERRSYANHIADVVGALGIRINLDRGAHDTAAPRAAFRPSDADVAHYAGARARLLAHPVGRWVWELAEQHREEVVGLVTGHRPVTVAWHRAGGPALFARALEALRAGRDTLPAPPAGGTLSESLARIGTALRAHGSDDLRAAIDAHGDAIIDAVRGAATVSGALDALRTHAGLADREWEGEPEAVP